MNEVELQSTNKSMLGNGRDNPAKKSALIDKLTDIGRS